MFFTILLIAFFFSLFCFYYYSRDDYFFIRKNITMEQLFNVIFIGSFWGVISSRIVYVVTHPNPAFFNPLVFFSIPYYPGLSLLGGIFGLYISFVFLTKRRKIHVGRFLDYISISLLAALPFGYIGNYLLERRSNTVETIYLTVIYIALFIFFTRILFPKFQRGSLKEGSISLIFLIAYSIVSLVHDIALLYKNEILLRTEDFFFIGLFFFAAMALVRLETRRSAK